MFTSDPNQPELERPRRKRADGTFACEYCDDAGDVHSITGEWHGVCHCEIGQELQREMDMARAAGADAKLAAVD